MDDFLDFEPREDAGLGVKERRLEDLDQVTLAAIDLANSELPTYEELGTVAGNHMQKVWGDLLASAHRLRADAGLPHRPHGWESEP